MASSSEAWGAERDGEGKLVWFVPSSTPPSAPVPGVLLGWDDDDDEPSFGDSEVMVVHLLHVPADLLQGTLAHGAELRRELRLLALAHQDTYPVASDLSAFFHSLARDVRSQLGGEALLQALQTGQSHVDLEVKASVDSQAAVRAAPGAARPRRCVLPERAAPHAGPLARAGRLPGLALR